MNPEVPAGQPVTTTTPPLKDRYEVGERLAEGAFFYTHTGREVSTGRPVAIKVLKPEHATDEVFCARLLEEARIATEFQHPNIAQVFDAWREHGTVIIVSEWIRGINLKDRIRRVAPFPLAVVVDILLACAEALGQGHEKGIVHGNLRPDNIIITPDGRVKVTDFGLGTSAVVSSRSQLNTLSQAVYYLAPELAEGRPPSPATDLYALGCITFEMLTGDLPFDADTPLAVAIRHLKDPVPSAKGPNPSVPPAVDGIVQKLMQKDPTARYPAAKALLVDIYRVREGIRNDRPLNWSPLEVPAEPRPVEDRKPVKKQRPVRQEREPVEPDGGPSAKLLTGLAFAGVLMVVLFFAVGVMLTNAPRQVVVPRTLVGLPVAQAVEELRKASLTGEVREEYSERVPAGNVYDSDPKGGVELRAGKTVRLLVSRGPQPVTVPDVIGKGLDTAQNEVKALGLNLGETKEEYSEVIEKGQVISQSPVGGSEVRKKTPVNLVISKGREPIPEPEPVEVDPARPEDQTPPDEPIPPDETPEPQPATPDTPAAEGTPRDYAITVTVPARSRGPQTVRIVVRNEDGTEQEAYNQDHEPGETVEQTVSVVGAKGKCQIRVYINGELKNRTRI
jgi:eukaryotic-like serine/threonine-protein kinase